MMREESKGRKTNDKRNDVVGFDQTRIKNDVVRFDQRNYVVRFDQTILIIQMIKNDVV